MSEYEPSEAEVEAATEAIDATLHTRDRRTMARAALIAARALRDADEPDGAPFHRWEVTEGWQPRRENLHDEHNAERWPR